MINTVLLEPTNITTALVEQVLRAHCPFVKVLKTISCTSELESVVSSFQTDLVIADAKTFFDNQSILNATASYESIVISEIESYAVKAFKHRAVDFILKPIYEEELINAIQNARVLIEEKERKIKDQKTIQQLRRANQQNELIGIPTLEGFEYISIKDIVRCEGLQKCTRLITNKRADIVSSYSIGEFYRMLEPYRFFFTHKSHLINLAKVQSYKKEGTLIMQDHTSVPIAKRRKHEFLRQIKHLGKTSAMH